MSSTLRDLVAVVDGAHLQGNPEVVIHGVTHDSRLVQPGWVFVAMAGEKSDGHAFIDKAIRAGAAAIVAQRQRQAGEPDVPWITMPDTRAALGEVAAVVYGRPTRRMEVVGITGTNGKTTLTFLLEAVLRAAGAVPGVIGTVTYRWGGIEHDAHHTTPEASDLQMMFAEMLAAGTTHVIMEVSSHGLHRGRLAGCDFNVGVFTNLTHDHLDYHGNFEDYYLAKRSLFTDLLPASAKEGPSAVLNLDDRYGRRLAQEIRTLPLTGFGTSRLCQVRPLDISITADGIAGTIVSPQGRVRIGSGLTGPFNLSNILAAVATSQRLGIPNRAIEEGIASVEVVPGRLERIPAQEGIVFVDYAHTPNALKNVLDALRIIRRGRIVTLMGCGGDRDRSKRPVMGREAAAGSDFVVVTSDNPRSEDPAVILSQVEEGVRQSGYTEYAQGQNGQPLPSGAYRVMPDRREAISWAVNRLQPGDILLVAGKGHETYQEINGVRHPFDDREVCRQAIAHREAHAV